MQNVIYWNPGVTLAILEKSAILMAMKHFGGNKSAASRSLDISVRSLDMKLEQYEKDTAEYNERQKRIEEERAIELCRARGQKISAVLVDEEVAIKESDLPPVLPPSQMESVTPAKKIQVALPKSSVQAGVRQVR